MYCLMKMKMNGEGSLQPAVAIQRDWPAHRRIRAETLVTMFDIQLVVENAPPEYYRFAGEVRVDFVIDPGNRHPCPARRHRTGQSLGASAHAL